MNFQSSSKKSYFERIIACALLLAVPSVRAAVGEVIDQSNPHIFSAGAIGFGSATLYNSNRLVQTFTAGINGQLTRVDLQLMQSGTLPTNTINQDITLLVFMPLNGSSPVSGNPLATATISHFDIPGNSAVLNGAVVSVSLDTSPVPMIAGQTYSLELVTDQVWDSRPRGWHFGWLLTGNSYSGGTEWLNSGNTDFVSQTTDLSFQTFVVPVPEPSSLVMIGLGGAGLFLRCRK